MTKTSTFLITTIGAATLAAAPALAVEITGGDVSLSYSAFTEDTDLSRVAIEGSVEVGFTRAFSMQFDLARYEFGFADDGVTTGTVHAIFHVSDVTSVGAFYGREDIDGTSLDLYGAEVGHEMGALDLEAYIGHGEEAGVSGTAFGLAADYNINDRFAIGVAYDRVDFDGDFNIHKTALRASYAAADRFSVFGEVGSFGMGADYYGVTLDASTNYVGFGVEYAFGAKRGATFGERGLTRMLPGL
ncbi:porin [Aliiroseovarius sediminis]|uniref:porin n=1 Tax=Aliiroseovarius sediminis TaxID=2925839 RepID=UPI001F59A9E8|nr:porin [Aliiroseovarius sediminis]MCI2393453.1 hypothetical protein [Aliiroseovarius sediminis]